MDIKKQLDKSIALVGMMGTGKSHIGRLLAQALDVPFCDSDQLVEAKAGMSVADVFERYGEEKFRESEHKTILEVLDGVPCVLATGGGALMDGRTLEALKKHSYMVWLRSNPDVLWTRVSQSQNRPLLNYPDAKDRLVALLAAREPLYAQAAIHVDNNVGDGQAVVAEIIKNIV
ncbi:MAG: shikimate kinase [Alphaproteobacteria bacterium]|nr:shikimate kinase [Alphaproteobacteria bacterium]